MDAREERLLTVATRVLPYIDPTGAGRIWLDSLSEAISAYRPRKTAVITGNYQQYSDFLDKQGIDPRSHDHKYVWAGSPRHVRGYHLDNILTVGTWWECKDLAEVLEAARAGLV